MKEKKNNIVYLNAYERGDLLETWQEVGLPVETEQRPPEHYYTNPDPYAAAPKLEDGHYRHDLRFDEEGHIVVKNLSAYWLPDIRIEREIDGTIYTVTGSYEGTETLDKKLLRIMLKNMEDSR